MWELENRAQWENKNALRTDKELRRLRNSTEEVIRLEFLEILGFDVKYKELGAEL